MKKRAKVVIAGRTNVGKSSLFNRLSTSVKAITFDCHGVTRDCVSDTVYWQDACFELIDTGGVSLTKAHDDLVEKTRQRALSMIEHADVILFVVDGSVGPLAEDRAIARLLHKERKNVILIINKSDVKTSAENAFECARLGFKEAIDVSCQHGTGVGDVLELIVEQLAQTAGHAHDEEKAAYNVVLLGKPNVGKSSLLNLLVNKERAIVSDVPGTTRESISERVAFCKHDIVVTDTPGIRRKRSVHEGLETMMVKSSLRALDDAHIVILMIDAHEGQLADQELKLAFHAFADLHKALIILFNKDDLADQSTQADLARDLEGYAHLIDKVEHLSISCTTGKNIGKIMPLVEKVWKRYEQKLNDHELTFACKEALTRRPLYHKTQLLKLFRVRQVKTAPPTLLMIVNQPRWFGDGQLGFFDNVLRATFDLKSVPLVFIPRTS